jgi:ATP-dependent DNA helicase DinG
MNSIVALDIETTGLDPEKEAIIEIGAVRFNDRRVEAEWTTLVNPGRPIPPFITQLTGISDSMVREMPPLRSVLTQFKEFVGDAPVLGHNIRFDLSFLRRLGALQFNEYLDTYDMAAVLMPTAGRYNLGALAQLLAVPLPATHRALDDARVTRAIYQLLHQKAVELPLPLLAELVRLADQVEWGGYWGLYNALRTRSQQTISAREAKIGYYGPLLERFNSRGCPPLVPNPQKYALDIDEVAAFLEYGGSFSKHFPHYEFRPQQVEMMRAVCEALSEGHHLLVEAGTGTGKSIAYLIPAAIFAIQNNARVVISTNTINLQEQLIKKDIPDLMAALSLKLKSAVMKGRANYLCPRRMENIRRKGPVDGDEMRVLAKVMVWIQDTLTGDKTEINLNGPVEREIWMRLCAEDEGCNTENCMKRTGGHCPFLQARNEASSAHLLIVNHALLLADVATGNRVLPEYDYLIVDEAHHLEAAITNALSFHLTQTDVDRTMRELGGPKGGMLAWLIEAFETSLPPEEFARVDHLVQSANAHSFNFEHLAKDFFRGFHNFLMDQLDGKAIGAYAFQVRILSATRSQPAWGDIEITWDQAALSLKALIDVLGKLIQGLADTGDRLPEGSEDLFSSMSNLYRRLSEYFENLHSLVFSPSEEVIYWAEIQPNLRRTSLHAAPLHVGPLMEKYLWNEKTSAILTSATLTTAGEFDYIRSRLFAETAYDLSLGSPFDYETASLVYVVNDIPEPSDRFGHQRAVENALIHLCTATGGRTLALFTSYDQLKRTSQNIGPILAKKEIRIYEQGEGASPHALLENFRTTDRAVLLGTRAFWEGVDVPGDALSVLAIVKLPFDVPTDPIIAARSETFDDPFYQFSLPEAILKFRQGFGRLIRTQHDRGVVAILDKRILTKRYGQAFLDSLPPCTVKAGPLSSLPRAATRWLNL